MTAHLADLPLGYHLLIDMYDCNRNLHFETDTEPDLLPDKLISNEINSVGLTSKKYITEIFDNLSWSSCFILAESHLSLHTWPEEKHVSADIYVCNFSSDNRSKADQLKDFLMTLFGAGRANIQNIARSTARS